MEEGYRRILTMLRHSATDITYTFPAPLSGAGVIDRVIPAIPNLGRLQRGRSFSTFNRSHMQEAMQIVRAFTGLENLDECTDLASTLRSRINEELFVYCMYSTVLHRPDTRNAMMPPIEEILPYKFVDNRVIKRAWRTLESRQPDQLEPIEIPYNFSGNDLDPEHRLAYFREDIGINSHHWHWHIVFPIEWRASDGGLKDRKGELFYYMHQQIMARYDAERFSLHMARTRPLQNWTLPVPEGYSPHLTSELSGQEYANRPSFMTMEDVPGDSITLDRLQTFRNRIIHAIHTGTIIDSNGETRRLDEQTGIDVLGDMIEASSLSPNMQFYGDFHNLGHIVLARMHDPDRRFLETNGVMGFSETAIRDPVFFRWHRFIDDIFVDYKETLTPYTTEQLNWSGVSIQGVTIQGNGTNAGTANQLETFWQERVLTLSVGVNFTRDVPVTVKLTHLQHEEYDLVLDVDNSADSVVTATVRVFLAPTLDEASARLPLNQMRRLFIELDKFQTTVEPGRQTIQRRSMDSNVTIPSPQSFGDLLNLALPSTVEQSSCSCGWPHHMLLPRGRPEGMNFTLFVMVTNGIEDQVEQVSSERRCADATSYCGIRDERYPDRKPMGFPFDRRFEQELLSSIQTPNMVTADVVIVHSGRILDVSGNSRLVRLEDLGGTVPSTGTTPLEGPVWP